MANPNPEIWGDSTSWHDTWFIGGSSGAQYDNIGAGHIKVANFGGTLDNESGTLSRGVAQNKITANQPIDATICPCGQDSLVSPFAKIAIFPRNTSHDTVIDPTPIKVETTDGNINWFFCEMNSGADTFGEYHYTGDESGYDQWSPNSINSNDNLNFRVQPFVYWQTKSLMLTIMVRPITSYDSAGIPIGNVWVTLDEWKNSYSAYPIMGYGLRGNTVNTASLSGITYSYATGDTLRPLYFHCGVIKDIDECNRYQVFYGREHYSMLRLIDAVDTVDWDCRIALPLYQYFTGQITKFTRNAYWYEIPYSAENYEKCLQIAACFGCYFTPSTKMTFALDFTDNDLYLAVIDENGIAHGQYTKGAGNVNNSLYDKSSIRDIDYDPDTPVDPNTYSDTTNWNNVNFQQAFTKRYLLNATQVAELSNELWAAQSSKPADIDYHNFAIDEYLTNNPIDTIVSLKYFPCTFADVAPAVVHLGKYTTNIAATALGTSVRIIDFAPIECFPHFDDFRDYEPYTELAMYIPFCGTVKIPTAECMGNYVSVKLAIDTSTGAATGYVIVSKTGTGGICVATCQGMAAIDIPVSGLQSANLANAVFNATANWTQTQVNNISANSGLFKHMGGTFGTLARGMSNSFNLSDVKGGILGGPIGAVGTLVNSLNPISALQKGMNIDIDNAKADYELSHIQVPTRLVGSASPVLGCVIELDCRLIIYRPVTDETALSNYADTVGYATVQGGTVSQFSGFTVGTIDVSGINATAKEKQAIAAAFANGVYL